ncbi:MAG TPA: helix-turn-helix domain-containing protein [Acidimicrobiales bacterium]
MARPAPAVNRALKIIDLLVSHPTERFTLSQLVQRTGISLGSAHAVLAVLEQSGYVSRHRVQKTYALGPALVAAGVAALSQHPAIRVATERLPKLAAELGAEALVTAATPTEIIFVARAGDPSPYGPVIREGERVPLVPPLGAVFMAWSDDGEKEAWLQRAPLHAQADRDRYERLLAAVRERGCSISTASRTQYTVGDVAASLADSPSRDELRAELDETLATLAADTEYGVASLSPERTYDIGMIAAPVFDSDSRVLAAIVGTGFEPGLPAGEVARRAEIIRRCAIVVTKHTQGRPPQQA